MKSIIKTLPFICALIVLSFSSCEETEVRRKEPVVVESAKPAKDDSFVRGYSFSRLLNESQKTINVFGDYGYTGTSFDKNTKLITVNDTFFSDTRDLGTYMSTKVTTTNFVKLHFAFNANTMEASVIYNVAGNFQNGADSYVFECPYWSKDSRQSVRVSELAYDTTVEALTGKIVYSFNGGVGNVSSFSGRFSHPLDITVYNEAIKLSN